MKSLGCSLRITVMGYFELCNKRWEFISNLHRLNNDKLFGFLYDAARKRLQAHAFTPSLCPLRFCSSPLSPASRSACRILVKNGETLTLPPFRASGFSA